VTAARRSAAVVLAAGVLFVGIPAGVASAHPLGNFTVNHYDGLTLRTDSVELTSVLDRAEIPTAQLLQQWTDGAEPTAAQLAEGAGEQCAELLADVSVAVDGTAVEWASTEARMTVVAGAGGLPTLRLTCTSTADADLDGAAEVTVADEHLADRVGWREMTATGEGVALLDPPVPAESVSDELRTYPDDLLASPVDVRTFTVATRPGSGGTAAPVEVLRDSGDPFTAAVTALDRRFEDMVGRRELTPLVGGLAVLLAVLLGCGHALLPGHGKSVMAAYLAGRRGRSRDAVLVGATVTATHTVGVLALGAAITVSSAFAGDQVLRWLGIGSGLLVAAIGAVMLRTALPRWWHGRAVAPVPVARVLAHEPVLVGSGVTSTVAAPHHDHDHPHGDHEHEHPHHDHPHDHEHPHPHPHPHPHDHEHPHGDHEHPHHDHPHGEHDHPHHDHPHGDHDHGDDHAHGWWSGGHSHGPGGHTHGPGSGRGGLIGMGVAGGLVPSPSALIVLLASVGLGRTGFGVVLVLAYGLGMAGTLTAVGLLLVKLRGRLAERYSRMDRSGLVARLASAMPVLTATLVLVVGASLALRGVVFGA
jgi:nickel/cobalt exporter